MRFSAQADLDPPGETGRQARVLAIWLVCLGAAVIAAAASRPSREVPPSPPPGRPAVRTPPPTISLARRVQIAFGLGVLLPGVLTWWETHRRKRGGPHPRGIQVDVTDDGDLRVWGRGYGQRARLDGAEVDERLVEVFCGRLGAWRERRLEVRATRPHDDVGHRGRVAIATVATKGDMALDLPQDGGEGDCVELTRDDYLAVRRIVLDLKDASERPGVDGGSADAAGADTASDATVEG